MWIHCTTTLPRHGWQGCRFPVTCLPCAVPNMRVLPEVGAIPLYKLKGSSFFSGGKPQDTVGATVCCPTL